MRKMLSYAFGCWVLTAGLIGFVAVLFAYARANPTVQIPPANRQKFVNVAILLDGTASMSDLHFKLGRQILVARVIPNIGVGDKLACYAIGPDFGMANVISGGALEDQPPQYSIARRREVVELLRAARSNAATGRVRVPLYALANELGSLWPAVDEIRRHWTEEVQAIGRPAKKGTNLACAVDAFAAYFEASTDPYEEKVLIVVSDLVQDSVAKLPCSGESTRRAGLNGVRIVLLYPNDSSNDWTRILAFWKRYFGDHPIETSPFAAVLNQQTLLAPNPLAGLEAYRIQSFTANLVSVLDAAVPAMGITLVLSVVLGVTASVLSQHSRERRRVGATDARS